MSFPHKKENYTPEEWKAQIEKAADALAEHHSLDNKRVREMFHKMDAAHLGYPGFPSESPLKDAIAFIEPEKAIQLFENTDPVFLMNRYLTYNRFLFPSFAPFYTHNELADLIVDFIDYQKINQDKIIQTGFPNRPFSKSLWLDGQLSRLYFVKLPLDYPPLPRYYYSSPALKKIDQIFNTKDSNEFYSIWIRNPQEAGDQKVKHKSEHPFKKCSELFLLDDFYFENGVFYDKGGNAVAERCEYYKAPMLDFLTSVSDLVEIISIRAKFFNMRIEILEVISNALKKDKSSKLWENCLAIMTDKYELQKKQVDMLNHVDSILKCTNQDEHEGKNMRLLMGIPYIHIDHPYRLIAKFENNSGFGDLIHFIGWNEIELKTGVMNEAKKRLQDFPLENNFFSYYQLVDQPCIKKFDEVLDNFSIASEKQNEAYKGFYKKVYDAYGTEFLEPPDGEIFIRSKYQEKYKREIFPFVKSAAEQYEAEGRVCFTLNPPAIKHDKSLKEAKPKKSDDFVFYKDGATWRAGFEGKEISVGHSKGMYYIDYLLKTQGKNISALDLNYAVNSTYFNQSGFDLSNIQTLESLKEELRMIEDDIAIYEDLTDQNKLGQLQERKLLIQQEIKRTQGLGGRIRQASSSHEKARQAITTAIRKARNKIAIHHPNLAMHLKNSLNTGSEFSYTPENPLPWKFQ